MEDRRSNVIVAMLLGLIITAVVAVVLTLSLLYVGHALAAPTTIDSSHIER